jgi:hypothetical protein
MVNVLFKRAAKGQSYAINREFFLYLCRLLIPQYLDLSAQYFYLSFDSTDFHSNFELPVKCTFDGIANVIVETFEKRFLKVIQLKKMDVKREKG